MKYANKNGARKTFLFGHHPWFLFHEDETPDTMEGRNHFPEAMKIPNESIPDMYFTIPKVRRKVVLDMCRKYKVDACFAGHYHQNLMGITSWGMPMITTGPLCNWILSNTAKDMGDVQNFTESAGVRVVTIDDTLEKGFTHCYECLPNSNDNGKKRKGAPTISGDTSVSKRKSKTTAKPKSKMKK